MKITLISTDNDVTCHGIRAISSYLKMRGYKTNILFLPYGEDISRNYNTKVIKQVYNFVEGSDVIGFSTMSFTAFRVYKLAKALRKLKKPLVIGGLHATIAPDECLKYFDFVCIGEGEEAFLDFLKKFENKESLEGIKNFCLKKSGKIIRNELRPLLENIDFIPDYDTENHFILENDKLVKFKEKHLEGRFLVHTSRGCPHSCTYCCNNLLTKLYSGKGKQVRKRSVDSFIKELRILKNKFPNVNHVWFTDDSFFVRNIDEAKEFWKKYKKININFECYASPLTLNEEKLKMFMDAGLDSVSIGIQTGCERLNQDLYKRYMPNEKILEASKLFHKYKKKIKVYYHFIISNPYEANKELLESINLIKKLKPPFEIATFNLAFFKGTELYNKAVDDRMIKKDEDTAVHLHLHDLMGHLRIKKLPNAYLNSIIYWMSGRCTRNRYGFVPKILLPFLTNKRTIKLFDKFKFLTYTMNISLFSIKSLYYLGRIIKGKAPKI